jgi:hypothetical protein
VVTFTRASRPPIVALSLPLTSFEAYFQNPAHGTQTHDLVCCFLPSYQSKADTLLAVQCSSSLPNPQETPFSASLIHLRKGQTHPTKCAGVNTLMAAKPTFVCLILSSNIMTPTTRSLARATGDCGKTST